MIKNAVHPGMILQEDVLKPLGLSIATAASRLGISRGALSRIINGHRRISASVAIRLERAGVGSAQSWVNLQAHYDLATARSTTIGHVGSLRPKASHYLS